MQSGLFDRNGTRARHHRPDDRARSGRRRVCGGKQASKGGGIGSPSMSNWQVVHDAIHAGNVASAITALEAFLAKQDANKFSCLLNESFSNSPRAVLDKLNSFIESNNEQFDVKALYLEMNGFGINYDEWFFAPLPMTAIHQIPMIWNGAVTGSRRMRFRLRCLVWSRRSKHSPGTIKSRSGDPNGISRQYITQVSC